eukprot:scaffold52276_cov66-Phaeocystis_antarctica.AAC.2
MFSQAWPPVVRSLQDYSPTDAVAAVAQRARRDSQEGGTLLCARRIGDPSARLRPSGELS